MIIGDYRVARWDEHNLTIEEQFTCVRGKNVGDIIWKVKGYYPNLKILLPDLLELMTTQEDSESIEELQYLQTMYTGMILNKVKEVSNSIPK